jgi:hypothetical protein
LGDGAYGSGLTAGVTVFGPHPVLWQVRRLHVPIRTKCSGTATTGSNPNRVVRCHHVCKPDPLGACAPWPASGEEVRHRHVPLRKWLLSQLCHVSGGSKPSAGRQPNYRIKCG